ncbi:leucyl aminopeptidase [Fulvimarina sp. 2208YS6-2-32]|uniref:Probable cytosol aminopeptidase n=1 Tax=Fulvimarina uroteuthidis TaxID=3098149 RepID=A0ABU5I6U3_9HYPH|nr:leucyl aminopeptidase [Fulvimarina sp. 2208YS6-2-32]MDY8110468.1 leucyl aminopeptidase [Fulvimarina sp. 2208YS6-2-32]
MASLPNLRFSSLDESARGVLVILAGKDGRLADAHDGFGELVAKASRSTKFKGKALSKLDLVAPAAEAIDRLLVIGTHLDQDPLEEDWLKLGGTIAAATKGAETVTISTSMPGDRQVSAAEAAMIGAGMLLRTYNFDRYKTKKTKEDDEEETTTASDVAILVSDVRGAEAAFEAERAVAEGTMLARDLVNEPANILGPVEYAERTQALRELGLKVEILEQGEMEALKMHALLGVSQGSPRPPRLVIMRWNGGEEGEQPIAFVGKGVVFDTGGISIKPAGSMDEMKGDMGGSAAVVGLMHALGARKAKVNAIGIVGLVENSVDGNAQRPGDIVTAMSGTTIEVLNTDAEGRLVLADALWYCQDRFKPKFMVNLATLTGAIVVALGNHQAGLFSNNDELADRLFSAGKVSGEKVWRLPLGPEYDKMIEGKFADIKNIGSGRAAGSITAAQFLQRFVNDVPWAHLDIAGTAMGSPSNAYNQSWASGFGVRLLERLVRDHYENR